MVDTYGRESDRRWRKAGRGLPDHGFMYGSSFYDIDGHDREVFWMDPKAVQ